MNQIKLRLLVHYHFLKSYLGCQVLICSLFAFSNSILAAPTFPLSKDTEITGVIREIQMTREEYVKFEEQKRAVLSRLYEINQQKRKISTHKNELTNQLLAKKANAKNLAKMISDLETKLALQKKFLRRKLRMISQAGQSEVLNAIFSSSSIQDLDQNLYYLKRLAKNDQSMIKNYSKNLKTIKQRRSELNRQVAHLMKVEKKVFAQEEMLVEQQHQKSHLIQGLNEQTKARLWRLKLAKEKAKEIRANEEAQELADLFRPSFFEQKGKLPHPISGPLKRGFGLEQDTEFKYKLSHKGHFYQAELGQEFTSVFPGKVIFAGFREGFQNLVVLDHGDHFYTVYSYAVRLLVSSGQSVDAGEVLGHTGLNPMSNESGLYFEIRHFSEPEDPASWLKDHEVQFSGLSKDPDTL